jgi:uncharacterized membrane protein
MEFINQIINALVNVHPLHPMFVHFPIALTGAAFFFILLAWWQNSRLLEQVAFANISLAALATLVAGATGFYDNLTNYGGNAPNAGAKIALAVFLLVLTTAIAVNRWRNPGLFDGGWRKGLYIAAYGLSFLVAFVLAFLGGIIMYGF